MAVMSNAQVLLVDDDEAVLFAYESILGRLGIAVDRAHTLEDAKRMISQTCYLLVVADVSLVGMGGEEGLAVLAHAKSCSPKTKVILLTGYGSKALEERAYAMGAAMYFEKPLPLETLKGALSSLGLHT
jgi:DNA-binding NtrC family response regulator